MPEGLLKIAGRWKEELSPELKRLYDQLVGQKNMGVDPATLTGQVHQFPPGFKRLVADRIFGSTPEPSSSFAEFARRTAPLPQRGPAAQALERVKAKGSGFKWPAIIAGGALGLGGLGILAAKLKDRQREKKLTQTPI